MAEQITTVEAEFTLLKRHFTGIKRRVAQRYRCGLATLGRLFFPETGASEEAWVHNLSETGIGLNLTRSLEAGTPLLIRLKSSSQELTLKLPAKVVHATPEIDGTWRVGCAFDANLSPDELDALL